VSNNLSTNGKVVIELDMSKPIERAIAAVAQILVTKGDDYASIADPFSNFRGTADHVGLTMPEVAQVFMMTKLLRLRALRENGALPQHESVGDSYMDLAAYAILAYAMYLETEVL
jgi:hypothetical protein